MLANVKIPIKRKKDGALKRKKAGFWGFKYSESILSLAKKEIF